MSARYQYEALSTFQKAAIRITSPLSWPTKAGPWIFDRQGGIRLQLAADEDAVLGRLRDHSDATFDHAAQAVMDKRRGYVFSWDQIARVASGNR